MGGPMRKRLEALLPYSSSATPAVFCVLAVLVTVATPFSCGATESAAFTYLVSVMDQFNSATDVFTDLGSAGNHFAALCELGEDLKAPGHLAGVSIDEAWTQNCHRGATCIRNSFSVVDLAYWGGWYFDNGVLSNGERQPACNCGQFLTLESISVEPSALRFGLGAILVERRWTSLPVGSDEMR